MGSTIPFNERLLLKVIFMTKVINAHSIVSAVE